MPLFCVLRYSNFKTLMQCVERRLFLSESGFLSENIGLSNLDGAAKNVEAAYNKGLTTVIRETWVYNYCCLVLYEVSSGKYLT